VSNNVDIMQECAASTYRVPDTSTLNLEAERSFLNRFTKLPAVTSQSTVIFQILGTTLNRRITYIRKKLGSH